MANRAQEMTSSGANKQQRGGRPGGGSAQGMSNASMPAKDPTYGIVSVLYHALQGAETYQQYIKDAQKAGDADLQQFFETCQQEEHARAVQAKSLLMERLEEEEDDEGSDDESDEEEE